MKQVKSSAARKTSTKRVRTSKFIDDLKELNESLALFGRLIRDTNQTLDRAEKLSIPNPVTATEQARATSTPELPVVSVARQHKDAADAYKTVMTTLEAFHQARIALEQTAPTQGEFISVLEASLNATHTLIQARHNFLTTIQYI